MHEENIISAYLSDYKKFLVYIEQIKPEYFKDLFCRKIWDKIQNSYFKKSDLSILELSESLTQDEKMKVFEMSSEVVYQTDFEYSLKSLTEASQRLFLKDKGIRLVKACENDSTAISDALEIDSERIQIFNQDIEDQNDLIEATLKDFDEISQGKKERLKTGNVYIDGFTDGFEAGSLNVLGARPGNGKTSFCVDLLYTFPKNVIFYSLEMSKIEIGRKMYSRAMGINSTALKEKWMIDKSKDKIIKASSELKEKKYWADYRPAKTPTEMMAQCGYLKHKFGLDLIVIDYIQIMKLGEPCESKTVEVGKISQKLKDMAKTLNTPILALTQLVRGAEQRTDKRPLLSDIRWAGEIEENAHKVMFLHVPSRYDSKLDPNLTEIIMAKNRSGEAGGKVDIYVDRATSTHRIYTQEDATNWGAQAMRET